MNSPHATLNPLIPITLSDLSENSSRGPSFARFSLSPPRSGGTSTNRGPPNTDHCRYAKAYRSEIRDISDRLRLKHKQLMKRTQKLSQVEARVRQLQGDLFRYSSTVAILKREADAWKANCDQNDIWRDKFITLSASIAHAHSTHNA